MLYYFDLSRIRLESKYLYLFEVLISVDIRLIELKEGKGYSWRDYGGKAHIKESVIESMGPDFNIKDGLDPDSLIREQTKGSDIVRRIDSSYSMVMNIGTQFVPRGIKQLARRRLSVN